MSDHPWPAAIDALLDRPDAPIEAVGPDRWAVGSRRVRRLADDQGRSGPDGHRRFLARLAEAAPFAVPTVVGTDGPWLVTEAPPGLPADRPDRHPEPGALATRIGEGLAALHALPPALLGGEAEPVDPWAPIVERARTTVAAGLVDPTLLPSPYDRYPPDRLVEFLVDAGGPAPAPVDPVLCHGAPEAARFLVDGDRFVGFDAVDDPLVADRHLDLAVAQLSVADALGAEAVYAFYDGYGRDPDLASLDRAVLARHLVLPAAGSR